LRSWHLGGPGGGGLAAVAANKEQPTFCLLRKRAVDDDYKQTVSCAAATGRGALAAAAAQEQLTVCLVGKQAIHDGCNLTVSPEAGGGAEEPRGFTAPVQGGMAAAVAAHEQPPSCLLWQHAF
jgi:hypothetical protein